MRKSIFKTILFAAIFAMIFSYLSNLFCRKSLEGTWNQTQKTAGFYNEPKNEFDIMFFGSSNTYCSFNPLILYEETGLKSYVFATQQQPVWATYAYIKDALKTQSPKLLVVDVLMFSKDSEYYDDGVNYSFMDDMPLSLNKIRLAIASAPRGDRVRLLVNFIKYHSRWSELTEDDYKFKRKEAADYLKGYTLLENVFDSASAPVQNVTESTPLGKKEILYFEKTVKLAKEKNIPLLFVKAPSNATEEEQKLFNSAEKLAEENGIEYINFNALYNEIGLDLKKDFYDKSHLNYIGAEKFTRYFAKNICKKYTPETPDTKNSELWLADIDKYYEYTSNIG